MSEPDAALGGRPDPPGVPVRYRIVPLLVLVLVALVPVAGLVGLLVWSDEQADAHEAVDGEGVETFDPTAEPTPTLSTAVLTFRRAPSTMAGILADNELAIAMEQLAAFVDRTSCLAVSIDGRAISSWNGDTPVIPASTNKLLVAGAALEVLGEDHRFTTTAVASAPVDGTVEGDLYLVGGGDPLLVTAAVPPGDDGPDPAATTSLDELADEVAAAGITAIDGAVVGDASRYDDQYVNPAWGSGVGYVDAGPIAGLVVNDGQVVGRSGRQRDPGDAAAREFVRLLRERGIEVRDGSTTGTVDPGAEPAVEVIAEVESAPLEDIVNDMLTRSDNDTAEMLLKELGVTAADDGSVAAGARVVDLIVQSWDVPMDGVVIADGSGLSPTNRLTCDTLVGVLHHLSDGPVAEGLAVAGRSGTLIDEFVGTPVEGDLVAKTGTLVNPPADTDPPEVKALAGYLEAPNDELLEFALVLNGAGYVTADGYVPFWGALADRLAAHPTGADPTTLGPR